MATSTTTIRTTPSTCGTFAAESDHGGLFGFRSLYAAYLACRKRKRKTANALRRRLSYAVIGEDGQAARRLKRRTLTEKVIFGDAPSVRLAA